MVTCYQHALVSEEGVINPLFLLLKGFISIGIIDKFMKTLRVLKFLENLEKSTMVTTKFELKWFNGEEDFTV